MNIWMNPCLYWHGRNPSRNHNQTWKMNDNLSLLITKPPTWWYNFVPNIRTHVAFTWNMCKIVIKLFESVFIKSKPGNKFSGYSEMPRIFNKILKISTQLLYTMHWRWLTQSAIVEKVDDLPTARYSPILPIPNYSPLSFKCLCENQIQRVVRTKPALTVSESGNKDENYSRDYSQGNIEDGGSWAFVGISFVVNIIIGWIAYYQTNFVHNSGNLFCLLLSTTTFYSTNRSQCISRIHTNAHIFTYRPNNSKQYKVCAERFSGSGKSSSTVR